MSRNHADLGIAATVAVLACAAALAGAPVAVTIVVGILLLAAPGYLLSELLFGSEIAGLERLVMVVLLAFSVPILGGLPLVAAGVPLHRSAWLGLLAGVTLACALAVYGRRLWRGRRGMPTAATVEREKWRVTAWHAVGFAAAVLIAGGAVGLASVGAAKQPYPGFTQLWFVPRSPSTTTAKLGVANHEGQTVRYRLVLFSDSRPAASWSLDLSNGRVWQQTTQFTGFDTLTAKLYRLPNVKRAYRYVTIEADKKAPTPQPKPSTKSHPHDRRQRRH
jgi:uncharacterized membrane protein